MYGTMMKIKLIMFWAFILACIACSDETAPQPVPDGGGQLRIAYKIAGVSMSRAEGDEDNTEPGWDGDWNENTITRVDLFVFNAGNTLFRHLDSDDLTTTIEKDNEGYTVAETQGLTYAEATKDKTYYMIANCPQLENATINTLSDLQAIMITPDLVFNAKQTEGFVMDDKGELVTPTDGGTTSTLTFDLERAAAKIRLTVLAKDKTTNVTSQCSFRLYNYVTQKAWVLAREEATASDGTSLTAEEVNAFYDLVTNETDITPQSMSALTSYSSGDLLKSNDNKVVFYSYPNDWFDESKAHLGTDGNWTIDDYTTTNPIIRDNQTYILLEAPYGDDGETYLYEIPVNLSTYESNDALSFSVDEYKEIRNLYRLQRNHIYNITVTIDQKGGITEDDAVTLDLKYLVDEWGEENVEIPEFN